MAVNLLPDCSESCEVAKLKKIQNNRFWCAAPIYVSDRYKLLDFLEPVIWSVESTLCSQDWEICRLRIWVGMSRMTIIVLLDCI